MSEKYYVVFGRQAYPSDKAVNTKPKASCEIEGPVETCKVVKVLSNAGTVAEAQELVTAAYPGSATDTSRVITSAQFKES